MTDLISSPYLIAILISWFGAHVVKYIIKYVKNEKIGFKSQLFTSGGMPSSHSTTVTAVSVIVGLRDGFSSGLFGLAVLFSLIVMYDAFKVRRSTSEQGEAISLLIKEYKSSVKSPKIIRGHTPLEVLSGFILGLLVGSIVFLATN